MLIPPFFSALLVAGFLFMRAQADIRIRIISHNIRYATTSPFTGERPWADRKALMVNELKWNTLYNDEVFVCLQEVLDAQLRDVLGGLGAEWDYIGVGRDDGKKAGEYSPILYRKAAWKVEEWKTVWLSETPDKPGKGWDAASIRIVTVGTFLHQASKKKVVGMCTHLDDQGQVSRTESAKLILRVVDEVTHNGTAVSDPLPVFLGGDLNSEPDGSAFQILNGKNSSLQAVKELAPWKYGNQKTFTGFQDSSAKTELDHVFVDRRKGVWEVRGFAVLPNRFDDGVYDSDHRAVVGDVVLKV
ncbi:hypothetical protein N0V90_002663 [Kalmusia sp. IMI 367209]|nr:hypothetical protein N0V90_002663 [Kalmusia sp. IMI 367209]